LMIIPFMFSFRHIDSFDYWFFRLDF
jgi:hypothetical protein